jgi:leucine dehydrogenase
MSKALNKTTEDGLVIEKVEVKSHEKVLKITNPKAKLQAIIAIHDTRLGMALGGTRIQPYSSFDKALFDVLRLSEGMSYKSAVAQVGTGGGKSVIIADPKTDKTPALLTAFGEAVDALKGEYICAEDVGCSLDDVKIIHKATKYVTGLPHDKSSGDPGRFTAWGTFRSIQATVNALYKTSSLEGIKIVLQGLGNVGEYLLDYLYWAGADIVISDIDEEKIKRAKITYGVNAISTDEVYSYPCDVFVPCAMGAIINDTTIPLLRCQSIAGCANNQLLHKDHADLLKDRNILFAPDFVVNAGGLLNVVSELDKEGYNPIKVRKQTQEIYDTLTSIYKIADKNKVSTHNAAIALGDYRMQYGIGKRTEEPYYHHSM